MSKETRTYKVGFSKGQPRVWLDGAVLSQYGFAPGVSFMVETFKPGKIVIVADKGGPRIVSGRASGKPIIDLRSHAMFEFIDGREEELKNGTLRVAVTFSAGRIVVILEN